MKYYATFCFILMLRISEMAQTDTINIVENTFKVQSFHEQILYYGFAEGDQLIFNFSEESGRKLKEVEILEYPGNSRFMTIKTEKIENKTFVVLRTGVYAFRFKNGGLFGRICRIRIDRIPADAKTKLFNTSIKWVEKLDTTWSVLAKDVLVGYDTLLLYKTKKDLVKTELSEDLFMTKDERVHSKLNSNGNKTSVFFTIPNYPSSQYVKKKVVSLIYWVGVGEEASKQWDKSMTVVKSLVRTAGSLVSPLGALAVGLITDLSRSGLGEDVYYALVDEQNKNLFFSDALYNWYDKGKGVMGSRKFTDPFLLRGGWYIVLLNDNKVQGINVNLKFSVMVQTDYYEEKPFTEIKITPRYENKTYKKPIVKIVKTPILLD